MRILALALTLVLSTLSLPGAPADGTDACDVAPVDGAYPLPAACSGEVWGGFRSPSDGWPFLIPERTRFLVEVTNDGTAFHDSILLDIIRPDGSHDIGPSVGRGATRTMATVAEGPGTLMLWLNGFGMVEHDIPYRLRAWLEPAPPPLPPQDDCGTGGDAIDSWGSTPIVVPIVCHGTLPHTDDPYGYGTDMSDIFHFSAREGETLAIRGELPANVTMCVTLYDERSGDWRYACAGGSADAPTTVDERLQVPSDATPQAWVDREWGFSAEYDFEIDVLPPVWHAQVEEVHLEAGAPQQPFGAFVDQERSVLGTVPVPEGYLVHWVPLARPLQGAGSAELTWTSELPSDVRLLLAEERLSDVIHCAPEEPGRITCDESDDPDWDWKVRWDEIRWAGIVVDSGIDVDATLTFRHWTYAE